MRRLLPMLAIVAVALATPGPSARAEDQYLRAALKVVDEVIVPGWRSVEQAAQSQHDTIDRLCDAPSAESLSAARDAFSALVASFGRIEFARFGPAREDFRFEKLFFWPDRRGRGLRQVQALLAKQDASATDPGTLAIKSAAVQGLPALEYLLSGTGADSLSGPDAPYRCRYALAVADNIGALAAAIRQGWVGDAGHRAAMATAGSENSLYRDGAEAARTILDAIREQLQLVLTAKLQAPLGESPDDARPRRAPLWRSGQSLTLVIANIRSIRDVFSHSRLDGLTPLAGGQEHERMDWLMEELFLELERGEDAVAEAAAFDAADGPFLHPDGREALTYATAPLGGALSILSSRYPSAVGLIVGFNALDGD